VMEIGVFLSFRISTTAFKETGHYACPVLLLLS